MRLDFLSCILTIISTMLVGRRQWQGWLVAGLNSLLICWIGLQTGQLGFVPANLFCLVLYGLNMRRWCAPDHQPVRPRRAGCARVSQSRVSVRTHRARVVHVSATRAVRI